MGEGSYETKDTSASWVNHSMFSIGDIQENVLSCYCVHCSQSSAQGRSEFSGDYCMDISEDMDDQHVF